MSVRRAQSEIDSAEFSEWLAYYSLEPFGEMMADMRHGIAVAVLANVNRDPEKRPEPYEPENFIYWHPERRERRASEILLDDPEAQSRLIKNALFGATKKG